MTRQIFAAEINFEDTPLHVRERFIGTEKNIKSLLPAFRLRVEEVFILSTRNRFTVYVVNENLAPLTEFFHEKHNLKGYVQFYYNSAESVTHLMATASGLLSPVKGDGRILAEIIRCYQWAADSSCLGMTLDHTLTRAIETGKTVRTKTGIDKFCASVVETGIELIYDRFENLHKKNFLIIGTGKMARLALDYLTREGIRNIAITGHEHNKAQELAMKFGVREFRLDFLPHYFFKADVVIGVSHEELKLETVLPQKKGSNPEESCNKIGFILDLGIPPNFDAQSVEMFAQEFYNLDDLRRLQPSPLESFGGVEAAWRMVMKAAHDFVYLLQLLDHSPVLTAYLSRQFTLKRGEWKLKPKKTLRSILNFRKSDEIIRSTAASDYSKTHINNHVAENGLEIVKNIQDVKRFKFYLSEN